MPELILLRHGQSLWNLENRFTGWMDIDLSPKGIEEAMTAGRLMKEGGYAFDIAHTSVLKRAIRTMWVVMDGMDLMWVQACKSWRLNERCYGALQGANKRETEEKYGAEQVHRWRRGFYERPPALDLEDPRHPVHDHRYAGLRREDIPGTESLKETMDRVIPYWNLRIVPDLKRGKTVFIAAHGNSLRALAKHVGGMSDQEIEMFEIPTGAPLVFELDCDLKAQKHFYLKDVISGTSTAR